MSTPTDPNDAERQKRAFSMGKSGLWSDFGPVCEVLPSDTVFKGKKPGRRKRRFRVESRAGGRQEYDQGSRLGGGRGG